MDGKDFEILPGGSLHRTDEKAVYVVFEHEVDRPALLVELLLGDREEDSPPRLFQFPLRADRHGGEKGVVDVGFDEADGMGPVAPQSRRGAVVDIAQPPDGVEDAAHRLLRGSGTVSEYEGYRRPGHACVLGDIAQRNAFLEFHALSKPQRSLLPGSGFVKFNRSGIDRGGGVPFPRSRFRKSFRRRRLSGHKEIDI
jgi:hypothetical protein